MRGFKKHLQHQKIKKWFYKQWYSFYSERHENPNYEIYDIGKTTNKKAGLYNHERKRLVKVQKKLINDN